jgi:hypothetical protein
VKMAGNIERLNWGKLRADAGCILLAEASRRACVSPALALLAAGPTLWLFAWRASTLLPG